MKKKKCQAPSMLIAEKRLGRLFLSWLLLLVFCGCFTTVSNRASITNRSLKRSPALRARVVLDPGHGGDDSGAVGRRGLMEKDITLDIAFRLLRIFRRHLPAVEVVLTRTTDRYVSLEERIAIAHKASGDVFVSLHVNSSEAKSASGFEVFSLDVASDHHSERLAMRENRAGGDSDKVGFILADLRAFSNRSHSDVLAGSIASGLWSQLAKTIPPEVIRDRGYKQAIFHVLFVKMPAVLTELFFISNEEEEKMLASASVREQIARGLFLGIKKFLTAEGTKHALR